MKKLNIKPILQIDDECAPACLATILEYFNIERSSDSIIKMIPKDSPKWRDWLYWLGAVALRHQLAATVVTFSTQVIDPSWRNLSESKLLSKLRAELKFVRSVMKSKKDPYQDYGLEHHPMVEYMELMAMINFLKAGGRIKIEPLTVALIESALASGNPVIASLDATILYRSKRGLPKPDDVRGTTWGHVAVVSGFDSKNFYITDPSDWYSKQQKFSVPKDYLIEAVTRRDQNILIIKKTPGLGRPGARSV